MAKLDWLNRIARAARCMVNPEQEAPVAETAVPLDNEWSAIVHGLVERHCPWPFILGLRLP